MSIAENIRRLRQRHGLSQAEFGAIAGVSDKAVSTWETGAKEPRMGAIQKLADHFHISKSDIIDDEPSDDAIKFALFGSVDVDDDVYEEVKRFAKFAQEQYRNRQG
jgi:transcriptional regulator with XRE-family HTH domain